MSTATSAPLVSIITPTCGRARFLPALARCVRAQTARWEWLVLDDSPEPDRWMQRLAQTDARVRYIHSGGHLSIGAKRGRLVAAARGEFVAHFDDDDYYAPQYLADMTRLLIERRVDLVKLSAFFVYAPGVGLFGYMDLTSPAGRHYMPTATGIREVEPCDEMRIGDDFALCYGFSYFYRRTLGASSRFADIDLGEDDNFIRCVVAGGHRVATLDDVRHDCLHVLHPDSTSHCFARYRMPAFLLPQLFPGYEGYPA